MFACITPKSVEMMNKRNTTNTFKMFSLFANNALCHGELCIMLHDTLDIMSYFAS